MAQGPRDEAQVWDQTLEAEVELYSGSSCGES